MLNHESTRKLVAIPIVTLLLATAIVIAENAIQSAAAQDTRLGKSPRMLAKIAAPIATSGNNVYMAWPNNDTGHWNVLFAKSTDGGKTLKIIIISAPNKGNTIDQNTEIAASGSNVYVTWWTNKTGVLMPLFRASNDGGNTFAKPIMLNSTWVNSHVSSFSFVLKKTLLFEYIRRILYLFDPRLHPAPVFLKKS